MLSPGHSKFPVLSIATIVLVQLAAPLSAFSADMTSNTGTQVSISLGNSDLPASDLIYEDQGQSHILSPEEAWQLKTQNHVDLSKLEPDPTTDIWRPQASDGDEALDNALPIQAGDTATFFGVITSSSGRFKFNVQIQSGDQPAQTLTLMISKDVHTYLLRKELLRRLGYRIPEMKYLSQVKIQFPDIFSRDFFLETQVANATAGAASRWCSVAPSVLKQDAHYPCKPQADETDPLRVTLQDVVAMQATPLYYNVAIGPPIEVIPNTTSIRPEGQRILRALALPYGLANISESINQVDWHVGRIQSGAFQFSVTDQANFSCTLDDALWITRRIETLTRDDFTKIVANAYYPDAVARVLVEKLISRRNSLSASMSMGIPALPFDAKVTLLPDLKNGKVMKQDWPGYASRFAWGDPDSPLRGLGWYVLSEIQSNVMETLLAKANAAIPQLSTESQTAAHEQQIANSLSQYFNSGMTQTIPLAVWAAPIVGGGIDLSRNVVLGQYMGTNNLVQLVDNFGANVNVGIIAGVDGLPVVLSVSGLVQATASIEFTHIKPLQRLKSAITEPLKNEIVLLLMHDAAGVLSQTATYGQPGAPTQTPDQLKKDLADTIDKLKVYLGVGESIIITESITGIQKLSAALGLPVPATPGIGVEADANQLVLSRLHFYRKDQNTIQIFKDNGQMVGAHVAFEATLDSPAQFPVLSLSSQIVTGTANSKIFTLNINPDPQFNPAIYNNASSIASALKSGSIEVLESHQQPTLLSTKFTESSGTYQFLQFMKRTLKGNGKISVRLPDGTKGNYVSLTGGKQTGAHYQALATQAATYVAQKITSDTTISINTNAAPDPGHSYLGHSTTKSAELQARLDGGNLSVPMVRFQYRWEGWNITSPKVIELVDSLSAKYGFKLYPDGFLMDTQSVKLYEIDLYISLYQSAFNQLLNLTPEQEDALVTRYTAEHHCHAIMLPLVTKSGDRFVCEAMGKFKTALATYRSGLKDPSNQAINMYNLASDIEEFLDFKDLVTLVGSDHLYVYSTINGFRIGSETLSDPIRSYTLGRADADTPDGILDAVENILGLDDGEFKMQWIRGVL